MIAFIFFICILIFKALNDRAVIDKLFTIAGYTYGPLLGLYSFGLFTNRQVKDRVTPLIAILSPLFVIFSAHIPKNCSMGTSSDSNFCLSMAF